MKNTSGFVDIKKRKLKRLTWEHVDIKLGTKLIDAIMVKKRMRSEEKEFWCAVPSRRRFGMP